MPKKPPSVKSKADFAVLRFYSNDMNSTVNHDIVCVPMMRYSTIGVSKFTRNLRAVSSYLR